MQVQVRVTADPTPGMARQKSQTSGLKPPSSAKRTGLPRPSPAVCSWPYQWHKASGTYFRELPKLAQRLRLRTSLKRHLESPPHRQTPELRSYRLQLRYIGARDEPFLVTRILDCLIKETDAKLETTGHTQE